MQNKRPLISMIAAISENRALGKNNKLLWHIPQDLIRFKRITLGHSVIMGRNTFESLGKPLPKRINIIITRNQNYQAENCIVCHSLQEALALAGKKEKNEVFIIGGGEIYRQGIKYAKKLYLTIVKGNYVADTYFPKYQEFDKIKLIEEGKYKDLSYSFIELEKNESI